MLGKAALLHSSRPSYKRFRCSAMPAISAVVRQPRVSSLSQLLQLQRSLSLKRAVLSRSFAGASSRNKCIRCSRIIEVGQACGFERE